VEKSVCIGLCPSEEKKKKLRKEEKRMQSVKSETLALQQNCLLVKTGQLRRLWGISLEEGGGKPKKKYSPGFSHYKTRTRQSESESWSIDNDHGWENKAKKDLGGEKKKATGDRREEV